MGIRKKHLPFLFGELPIADLTTDRNFALSGSTIDIGPRITGIVKNLKNPTVLERAKNDLPGSRASDQMARPENPLSRKVSDHTLG
jgi:hypothetical protein